MLRLRGNFGPTATEILPTLLVLIEYRKGERVYEIGSIHDKVFYVVAGELSMQKDGIELETFTKGSTFGVMVPANAGMSYLVLTTSATATLACVSSKELLLKSQIAAFEPGTPRPAGRQISARWKRAIAFAKVSASIRLNINVTRIRSTSLLGFVSSEICVKLASKSSERVFEPGESICKKGDAATACWVSLEGVAAVIIGGAKVWEYSTFGQLFGDLAFAALSEKDMIRGEENCSISDFRQHHH